MESETLDSLQRDWIIKLDLEPTSAPKVCKAKLVVTDRPGSGKHSRDEQLLTHTMQLAPGREKHPAPILSIEELSVAVALPNNVNDTATDSDIEWPDTDESGLVNEIFFQDDGSSEVEWSERESSMANEERTVIDVSYHSPPAVLNEGVQHTFVHHKLDVLAENDGTSVTVTVGHQKIPFIVPRFLLTSNFEFFRAAFEVGRWAEATQDTVSLMEESPVDFVLLLRFIIHSNTQDFNTVDLPCYPFGLDSNPLSPNREYGHGSITIAPWVMRVVALAERLCFNGSDSRLTQVLEATLNISRADRVTPALMDWLFANSAEESGLRDFVYDRLLQSLLAGDVDPIIYKPYAENDPQLMTLLLTRLLEHPLVTGSLGGRGWQELFTAHRTGDDNHDAGRKSSRLVRDSFDLAWCIFVGSHRYVHDLTPGCVETNHVWDKEVGWIGCINACAGCWNKDLGGRREEIASILLE